MTKEDSKQKRIEEAKSALPENLPEETRASVENVIDVMTLKPTKTPDGRWAPGLSPLEIWRKQNPGLSSLQAAKARKLAHSSRRDHQQKLRDAHEEALKILPTLIAQDLLEANEDSWTPSRDLLERLKKCMDVGLTEEKLRRQYFNDLSKKTWDKVLSYLYKDVVPSLEKLGLSVYKAEQDQIIRLQNNIRMIEKEMRISKRKTKRVDRELLKMKIDLEAKFFDMTSRHIATVSSAGIVGDKSKNTVINFIAKTPRPQAKDITPKTQTISLDDLIKKEE